MAKYAVTTEIVIKGNVIVWVIQHYNQSVNYVPQDLQYIMITVFQKHAWHRKLKQHIFVATMERVLMNGVNVKWDFLQLTFVNNVRMDCSWLIISAWFKHVLSVALYVILMVIVLVRTVFVRIIFNHRINVNNVIWVLL